MIAVDGLETKHLTNLNQLQVDVTELLEKRSERPKKITKIVASSDAAHVHVHHNDLNNVSSSNVQ